jgi:1,3-beta-glucan synthase
MLVIFIALLAGPLVARKFIKDLFKPQDFPMQLLQPTGLDNNDTSSKETGTAISGGDPTSTSGSRLMLW